MYVHLALLILSTCLNLYGSASSIPPEILKTDALLISKLARQIKELSPPVVREFLEVSCRVSTDCCAASNSSSSVVVSLFNVTEFLEGCFGETHSIEYEERVESCLPLLNMTKFAENTQLKQYMFITTMKNSDEIKSIGEVCTKEEIDTIICDWNDLEKHRSCREKLMVKWADEHDEMTYKEKVQQIKDDYNRIIHELKTKKFE